MARGEMVRYMAEKEIENPADVQPFDRLGYNFRRDLSSEIEYVFERKIMESDCAKKGHLQSAIISKIVIITNFILTF